MFQPVGGMDRIPYAFAKRLGSLVHYNAQVVEIRKTAAGVRIVHEQNGLRKSIEADYCICALPITILRSTPNDFSPRVRQAIEKTEYADAFKVAWESKRFWETDFNIYGGLSFVADGPVGLVWYPSARLFSDTGVLISGYAAEGDSPFSKLGSIDAKLAASRAAVERLHPGYGKQLSRPIYVNWRKIIYNQGSWVGREPGQTERDPNAAAQAPNAAADRTTYYDGPYKTFIEPDDRIYFAGDHCARVGAWQEGAALSAHRTVQMICDRVRMTKT
jgi:monoamine oxidase